MEPWSGKVGSIDRVRQRGIGDPTRSALPSCRQPATEEEEADTNTYNDNNPLTNVEGTGLHPGSLPRRPDRDCP